MGVNYFRVVCTFQFALPKKNYTQKLIKFASRGDYQSPV